MIAPDALTVELPRRLSRTDRGAVLLLAALEDDQCGRRVLPDQTRERLSARGTHVLCSSDGVLIGYAQATRANDETILEMTALPGVPAAADGLLDAASRDSADLILWAHGDRSAAGLLARRRDLQPSRELLIMTRPLPAPSSAKPPGPIEISPFDSELDHTGWLEFNRQAFAELPDQGNWTREDLDAQLAADWFDPYGFLVAIDARSGRLVGSHWTKADPAVRVDHQVSGEVFVLGVAQEWRGTGLAETLLTLGLRHLASRGLKRAHLFVDRDNPRAIRFYARAGFEVLDRDSSYTIPSAPHEPSTDR